VSDLLPLFPLPNVVLFPGVFLPLHIFEPRYREMVADALLGDRLIGMVLLKPGWESDYQGRPAVFPVGCSGVITHVERLEDGRFNIVLRGLERFRIVEENGERTYRRAVTQTLSESAHVEDRASLMHQRARLETLLSAIVDRNHSGRGSDTSEASANYAKAASAMTDEDLVHALAQYLDLEPLEKQALLEQDTLRVRADSLIELLEMKLLISRMPAVSNVAH
jgi:Lon protease-like protein